MQILRSEHGRMPRSAVVLGGSGFLGRNVCAALLGSGWSVSVVMRGAGDPPPGCRALRLDAVHGPLADALAAVSPALVVNAAGALWDVTDMELTEGNVTLVARLVSAVAALAGPVRLVHFGSAYEYGSHPEGVVLEETLTERPFSRYSQTKVAGAQVVTRAVAAGSIDAVVLRIATAVGPCAPRQSLLGGLAHQLAAQPESIDLPPISGERDIMDVRDVADAVLAAAAAPAVPPVVNIGRGTAVPVREVVDKLIQISGSSATITRRMPPAQRRDAGIAAQPMNTTLARRQLGWLPVRSLPDALQALWDSVRGPAGPTHAFTPVRGTAYANGDATHG
jgi:NDP-hexose 4-ketoreductase